MNAGPSAAAAAAETAARPHCLDILQVFDTFEIGTRSPTLDGSIPVRAAQGCKPLLDGNSAGLHLRARGPAMIQRQGGETVLRLSDEGFAAANTDYDARLESLVERGLLERDGYWHAELRRGFSALDGDTLRVWTGFLAKPADDVWLLVSTAFNRRCGVEIVEYVVSDPSGHTPLILEFDLTTLRHEQTWLDTEIATLTALRPGVRLSIRSFPEDPAPGRAFLDFYTPEYLERRGEAKYSGHYRKTTALQEKRGEDDTAWRVAYAGGARETIETAHFRRFLNPGGASGSDPAGRDFEYGLVRSLYDVEGRWDGSNLRDLTEPPAERFAALSSEWAELYGAETFGRAEWWASYVLPFLGPHRSEPFINQTPWLMTATAPGWSTISDGLAFPNLDPMRGVVSTDSFPSAPVPHQLRGIGEFRVPGGAPTGRMLPVPRELLQPGWRVTSV